MDENKQLWYLEEVDLLNMLCPHKTKELSDQHRFNDFRKDEFIYFENDLSDRIYLIVKGKVKIGGYAENGEEVIRTILGIGEIFGELALAGEKTRGDFAQAMGTSTSICLINIEDMRRLMKNNTLLNLELLKIMGFRVKKLQRKVESLLFKDAHARVIEFLRDMAHLHGRKVGFETTIKNYLTHKDIAKLTGTSRQTVTTILNKLKQANIISFSRSQILIRDIDKLK